uniref:Fumarate lyase N-terminal domain-containing protein n=1 Tax=Globodera rostochiensis TaxID=31243 RepID=A0A914I0U8_GLORO
MHSAEQYGSIFAERWCRGSPLLHIFSPQNKALIWRQLWIWLAESERELGLGALISKEMVDELKAQKGNIDWDKIKEIERQLKHDVMAHIQAYGEDNADLIVQRDALDHLLKRLAICLHRLANFAEKYADVPIEGRTHFQPASLTTVGKRAVLWADGLLHAFKKLNQVRAEFRFRGVKGAVGTQDALLQLFDGDAARTKALDAAVAEKAGFGTRVFGVCGQTYPRYQDSDVLFALSSLASATAKFASDLRILQAFGEMSEPFDAAHQVGSSAMPYKRNPMLCERICGIARYMMVNSLNPLFTFAEQGFERTLDDSANRRVVLPDAFLGADAILSTLQKVFEGMCVYESVVRASVHKSGALLERALMLLTQRGGNRQEAHERIRQIAVNGVTGDDLLGALPPEIRDDLRKLIDQPLLMCGQAGQQTRDFLANELRPTIAEVLGRVSDDDKQKTMVLDV